MQLRSRDPLCSPRFIPDDVILTCDIDNAGHAPVPPPLCTQTDTNNPMITDNVIDFESVIFLSHDEFQHVLIQTLTPTKYL